MLILLTGVYHRLWSEIGARVVFGKDDVYWFL